MFGSRENIFGSRENIFRRRENIFRSRENIFGRRENTIREQREYDLAAGRIQFGSSEDIFGTEIIHLRSKEYTIR